MSRIKLALAMVLTLVAGAPVWTQEGPDWWQAQRSVLDRLGDGKTDIADIAAQAAGAEPKSAQEAMVNLSVLLRAGMTEESVTALKELHRLAPGLGGHEVGNIYYAAFDELAAPWVAQVALEIFAANVSEVAFENRLLKYFTEMGWTVDKIDRWLARMPPGQGNCWVKERLRFNMQHGRGEALIKELEAKVRATPRDATMATAFLEALLYTRSRDEHKWDLAWMVDTVKPHLATEAEGIASGLKRLENFAPALVFFRKALDVPLTDGEVRRMQEQYQAMVTAELVRAAFAIRAREEMAECLLRLGRNAEAQKWMVEAADLRKQHNIRGNLLLAGQVQQASGQRVIEGRIIEEEKKSESDPAYWRERAEYYRGRREAAQEEEALKKGLALTSPKPEPGGKSPGDMRAALLGDYARFLARTDRTREAVAMLQSELIQAPADSVSSTRAANILAYDFPQQLFPEETLWAWLANRPVWDHPEERFLWRMLENAPAKDLDECFWKAEALAQGKDPSRAHTLGWIMNRMGAAKRSIPLLQYAVDKSQDTDLRQKASFTLFESCLDTGDWKGAERVFPEARKRLTPAELADWQGRIAVMAAMAGAKEDALRLWKAAANLNLTEIRHLDTLVRAGLRAELIEFYRDMQKKMPTSEAPARALKALGQTGASGMEHGGLPPGKAKPLEWPSWSAAVRPSMRMLTHVPLRPTKFQQLRAGRASCKTLLGKKGSMIKTVEAVVDDQGNVKLLEQVHLKSSRRALVVILDEPGVHDNDTALLSEAALSDWTRPEEDAAWSRLQSAK